MKVEIVQKTFVHFPINGHEVSNFCLAPWSPYPHLNMTCVSYGFHSNGIKDLLSPLYKSKRRTLENIRFLYLCFGTCRNGTINHF